MNKYYLTDIRPTYRKGGFLNKLFSPIKNFVNRRLYKNVSPVGYDGAKDRLVKGVLLNENDNILGDSENYRDNIYAEYLDIPENKRTRYKYNRVVDSKYSPTRGSKNVRYKALANIRFPNRRNSRKYGWDKAYDEIYNEDGVLPVGENKLSHAFGTQFATHTLGRGYDDRGEYMSYYDKWDVNPFDVKREEFGDKSFGLGNPIEFYDRMYLDDYFNVPNDARGGHYLPEVEVRPKRAIGGVLPELEVRPKPKSSEKRRIARRELAKQRLLSEIAPDIASILYYPYNII